MNAQREKIQWIRYQDFFDVCLYLMEVECPVTRREPREPTFQVSNGTISDKKIIQEIRHFFRRKFVRIVENSDQNIDQDLQLYRHFYY
jgi:hypothetical protein